MPVSRFAGVANRSARAVHIRCVVCGLLLTGVQARDGRVYASDRSRPDPDDPVRAGFCIRHAP